MFDTSENGNVACDKNIAAMRKVEEDKLPVPVLKVKVE